MKEENDILTKQYTCDEKMTLGWALVALAEAHTSRFATDTDIKVSKALRYITEFINGVKPLPKISKEEGDLSYIIHTYLRKNCDSKITSLIHRLRSDSVGNGIWFAFIKAVENQRKMNRIDWREILSDLELYYRNNDELPENIIMYFSLGAWMETESEEFEQMLVDIFKK